MWGNVGIVHDGVCAVVFGSISIDADIDAIKNRAIVIATVLFFENFIFFPISNIFSSFQKSLAN